MMTLSDVELLRSAELRQAIEDSLERDPAAVALDRHIPHARLVATQVKYLQRARRKLPHLYEARCIIPPRAFEQSSSEESAERKNITGDTLLDLTCGLGIDTMAFASRFRRVVALERDAVLAEVVRYNMSLLGIDNVEVVNTSAEEYLSATTEHFDWVFADPDRRSDEGRKMVCLEDCSPNIVALMPRLKEVAQRVGLKLSPLFDVDEAFRLCFPAEVEVVSLGGECKELNIYMGAEHDVLRIAVAGLGEWCFTPEDMRALPSTDEFNGGQWRYLLVPDVALQKARVAIAALGSHAAIWSNNGYAFAREYPEVSLPVRVFEIESIEPYRPKELKRSLKGLGVEIMKHDTTLSVEAVRRAIGVKSGCDRVIAITTIAGSHWVINLKM